MLRGPAQLENRIPKLSDSASKAQAERKVHNKVVHFFVYVAKEKSDDY